MREGQYVNDWWVNTDDDNGNRDVWVNQVYISGGANNQPLAGVRTC